MFDGTYTALVTPFRDGKVDEPALKALIAEQIAAGVEGLVPCGSTGESATLNHAEHQRVIAITIEEAAGRVKVIAGTGSNNTEEAASLTKFAKQAGADAALLISPYYNKPTQAGHVAHYRRVADVAELPLFVYNIPGRTGINMTPQTIAEMAGHPYIVGIKEASGNLDQISQIRRLAGPDFVVLSGDDALTLPMMAIGARGVISVVSNLAPTRMRALVDAALANDFAAARRVHEELLPLMTTLFIESNPIPIKTALAMLGKMTEELRMPLTPITAGSRAELTKVMREAGFAVS